MLRWGGGIVLWAARMHKCGTDCARGRGKTPGIRLIQALREVAPVTASSSLGQPETRYSGRQEPHHDASETSTAVALKLKIPSTDLYPEKNDFFWMCSRQTARPQNWQFARAVSSQWKHFIYGSVGVDSRRS